MSSSGRRLPTLSSAQVKAADALAGERFGVPLDWLMEAAGWQLARMCPGRTAVVCGKGNNGGDGLAAARHLHRWGRLHSVACVDTEALTGAAAREADALRRQGIVIAGDLQLAGAEVVLDALLGTGLTRAPEGVYARWIGQINGAGARVVAVDLPSGLEADTGRAHDPTVRAAVTVTLSLPKPGLLMGDGPEFSGEIWIADIGVPFEAYAALGLRPPEQLFSDGDQVRL